MGSMPEHLGHHTTETLSNLYRKLTQHSMTKLCIFTYNWIGLGNAATRYFWLLQGSAGDLIHTHIERMNCLTHYLLVCLYTIYFSTLGTAVCFIFFRNHISFNSVRQDPLFIFSPVVHVTDSHI